MAATQPGKKNVRLLKEGTPRKILLAEFGSPIDSEERNGNKYEIFKFKQGYSMPLKIGRVVFHTAADLFTLCLWEIVATPTEIMWSGKQIAYEVKYDENNYVANVSRLEQ